MIQARALGQGLCTLGLVAVLGGCASEYKKEAMEEQRAKTMPVNCATADSDLRTLQSEKVSVAQQTAAGVGAFSPIGLVGGVATGTEGEKTKVASGEYNKALDAKIAEIKSTCHIP